MKKFCFIIISFLLGAALSLGFWLWFGHPVKTNTKEVIITPETPAQTSSADTAKVILEEQISTASKSTALKSDPTPLPTTSVLHTVPFTVQAPNAQWSSLLFQDGCEEASLLMAARYFRDASSAIAPVDATTAITTLSHFARDTYGFYLDISAEDITKLATDFYDHIDAALVENITREDIIRALHDNALIILPMNGRALGNPHFTNGGPERHALLVIGYDPVTQEFITNDPGTQHGAQYRYSEDALMNAIRDYPSGDHIPFDDKTTPQELRRGIIISAKKN